MKVLFDANVLLSYLLTPKKDSTIAIVIETAVAHLSLVVPPSLLNEVWQTYHKYPHLRQRIDVDEVEQLVTLLEELGEAPTLSDDEMQALSRDPKDDYLLAYGLVAEAHYLVTGDQDLLTLEQVETLHILTPQQFLHVLREQGFIA
jgi:uncharacterized protein